MLCAPLTHQGTQYLLWYGGSAPSETVGSFKQTLYQAFLSYFSIKHLVVYIALPSLSGSCFGYFKSLALKLISNQLADFVVFSSG